MADTGTPDMSALLSGLMSDERFGEILAAVKKSMGENTSTAVTEEKKEVISATDGDLPQIPPEIISKIPEIMGMLSVGDSHKKGKTDERRRLLQALRPFLSEKRQTAVDTIVNITGITDIFGL